MTGIGRSRWLFVVAAAVAAAVAVAVVAAGRQGNGSSSVSRFDPRKEAAFEGKGLEAQRKGPSNPATEQVENRAYPRAYVDDRLALKSHDAFERKPEKLGSAAFATRTAFAAALAASPGAWTALGPVTPNVCRGGFAVLRPGHASGTDHAGVRARHRARDRPQLRKGLRSGRRALPTLGRRRGWRDLAHERRARPPAELGSRLRTTCRRTRSAR